MNVLLLITATTVLLSDETSDMRVKVLSFNIRYGSANDGANAWPLRQQFVFDVIRKAEADFCGLQEALRFQIDAIREAVPEYAEHGHGRDDGRDSGEFSVILYRKDRWQLDDGSTLWLSDTPLEPGSKSWGNTIPRIVTWGRFQEIRSGRVVYVFNTHFDHRSQPSRVRSAQFLAKLIAEQVHDAPLVVTGDLNAGEQNPATQQLASSVVPLVDTYRVLHTEARHAGTFNGFEGRTDGEKIDYVFTGRSARVLAAEIVRTHDQGRYPSDHFPVTAELLFGPP